MHISALTRLRLAFLALGVLVLVPLAWLLDSLEARLEAQRRLRHEVVAERIFDELERELTNVLGQRSLQAGLPPGQRPAMQSWPAFVIGYVQRGRNGIELVSRNGAGDSERLRFAADGILKAVGAAPPAPPIVRDALGRTSPKRDAASPADVSGQVPLSTPASPLRGVAPAPKIKPGKASQIDVLRNLNRAHEQRPNYSH
jgi:hypothetical protein